MILKTACGAIAMTMCAFLSLSPAQSQAYSTATPILPSQTDPRITEFNKAHMCWLPTAQPRHQLLLFIPGTGGEPKANFPLAAVASQLGYHVISLMYPDSVAAQQKCGRDPDPESHMKFRLALIRGGPDGPDGTVADCDSIEGRLTRLLVYLKEHQRGQGWDNFLDSNNKPAWDRIAVAGQSQGGGHAYVLGKYHQVARVLMFGSPKDYSFYYRRPAKGFDGQTQTPLDRFFAFNHLEDNRNGCNHDQQTEIMHQIGLDRLGSAIAEKSSGNYGAAHLIYTDLPPDQPGQFHGSVIQGKLPVCVPVWTYMLTAPVQ